MSGFIEELKRRKVVKTGIGYAVVAFVIMQLVEIIFPIFEFPAWTSRFVIILLFLGFPITIVLSWIFDKTPEGLKKTESTGGTKRLGLIGVIGALLLFIVYQNFFSNSGTTTASDGDIDSRSIAVLPFDNYSEDEKDAYISDGFTELIIANLAKIKDLRVISRTSVMQYENTTQPLKEIGAELGVANILEGSIHRVGDNIRIVGQLIDAQTDKHLWAETYDGTVADMFTIQAEVATQIAEALQAKISNEEKTRIAAIQTKSPDAYEAYVRGEEAWAKDQYGNARFAIKFIRKAVELDPEFAEAWARLGFMHHATYWFGQDRTNENIQDGLDALERARELKPESPRTLFAWGHYYYWVHLDYARALEYFNSALELEPGHWEYAASVGWIERRLGRFDTAIPSWEKSLKTSPSEASYYSSLVQTLDAIGDRSRATKYLSQMQSRNPENSFLYRQKALWIFYEKENTLKAREIIHDGLEISKREEFLHNLFLFDSFDEDYSASLSLLKSTDQEVFSYSTVLNTRDYYLGRIYSSQGNEALARKHLNRSRAYLETQLKANIADAMQHAALSRTLMALGMKEEAVREAELAVAIVPPTRDAWFGVEYSTNLAVIYGQAGDKSGAFRILGQIVEMPFGPKAQHLKLHPDWVPLRDDPRFDDMIEKAKNFKWTAAK